MKLKNRRYIICVENQEGITKYLKKSNWGSRGLVETSIESDATHFEYSLRYGETVLMARKKYIKSLKILFDRGERPRTFIKRVK